MEPNKKNFCGGNFQDWLEINLTSECNGKCAWCIEKDGFKPESKASYKTLIDQAVLSGKKKVLLLGGEPTLYPHLQELIKGLRLNWLRVFMTTNGSMLSSKFITNNLIGIDGVNISIHDIGCGKNKSITRVMIGDLAASIKRLHSIGSSVRFNCTCIAGHIDSYEKICNYIQWAKKFGVDSIRFSEVMNDEDNFVSLYQMFEKSLRLPFDVNPLNNNPFELGCNTEEKMFGVPVGFRQMCGLYTSSQRIPDNCGRFKKKVLYYNGIIYNGWQYNKSEDDVRDADIINMLRDVRDGKVTTEEAFAKLKGVKEKVIVEREIHHHSTKMHPDNDHAVIGCDGRVTTRGC